MVPSEFLFFGFVLTTPILTCSSFTSETVNGTSSVPTLPSANPVQNTKFSIPANYNKDERPVPFGQQLLVDFEIHVQAINPIKASDMDFRMELSISQTWTDPRLIFSDYFFLDGNRIIVPNEFVDQIWHPNPFFTNAKSTEVGQLSQRLLNIYIYPNQTVVYTIILFATVACSMQFQYYPWDFQLCPTVIESFSYDESLVKYSWSRNQPFTINPKLRLLQFVVTYPLHTEECSVQRVKQARNFSQLIAYFRFDRLLGNHLIQNFAPCFLITSLTWFSFWLELDAVSARVSLLVTSLLTLVTQFTGLKQDFPPVAYIKAVDLWMAMCLFCVCTALGEFVVVKVLFSMTEDAKNGFEGGVYATTPTSPQPSSGEGIQSPTISGSHISADISNSITPLQTMDKLDKFGILSKKESKNEYIAVATRKIRNIFPTSFSHESSSGERGTIILSYHLWRSFSIPLVWKSAKTGRINILWRNIDHISRFAFPLIFFICVTVYWTILFVHSLKNSPVNKPTSYCS